MPTNSSPTSPEAYADAYWASLTTRYAPAQLNLLKAFTKVAARLSWRSAPYAVNLMDFAPQWFEGFEPIKGTKSLAPAPSLDPESRAKFDALWAYSRSDPQAKFRSGPDARLFDVAGLFANAFLWEACFPEQFHARLPTVTSVFDFDPKTPDLAADIRRMADRTTHRAFALTSDITRLDCYRIPGELAVTLHDLKQKQRVAGVPAPADDAPSPAL